MKIRFIHSTHEKGCTKCAFGKNNLPLDVTKDFEVTVEHDNEYELMGWGSMRFNKECFTIVENTNVKDTYFIVTKPNNDQSLPG